MIFEYSSEFGSSFENTDAQTKQILTAMGKELGLDKNTRFIINFVLRELINNAIEHGNQMNETSMVKIHIKVVSDRIQIDVYDQGEGFDLEKTMHSINCNEILRARNRGLKSVMEIGFSLKVGKGHVSAQRDWGFTNF